jgi:hypothetical protein
MLDRDGTISFVPELFAIVDQFLTEYEALKGPLRNGLERGLVISYALGVISCDLEVLWDGVGSAAVFGTLNPRGVLAECVGDETPLAQSRRAAIMAALSARGWLDEEDTGR